MKIYSIDYKRHWGADGTVYTQTVKIDKELQKLYNSVLQKEYRRIHKREAEEFMVSNLDANILAYTKKLTKGVNYLHSTGLAIFRNVALGLDKKRRLHFFRNTIVEVL
jgi:hypothetical protein